MLGIKGVLTAAAIWAVLVHSPLAADETSVSRKTGEGNTMIRINVIVGDTTLSASLDNSPAARDFASMLPLELTLSEYAGNEMVADLGRKLDTTGAPASYKPKTGDITQYSPWSNLAIFTKPFSASRGLIRLGEFDGPIDALTVGGNVTARLERAD